MICIFLLLSYVATCDMVMASSQMLYVFLIELLVNWGHCCTYRRAGRVDTESIL